MDWNAAVWKPVVAIVPAAVVVLAPTDAPLAIRLSLGGAVYVVGLFLLRTFDAHDYAFVRAIGGLGETPAQAGVGR